MQYWHSMLGSKVKPQTWKVEYEMSNTCSYASSEEKDMISSILIKDKTIINEKEIKSKKEGISLLLFFSLW